MTRKIYLKILVGLTIGLCNNLAIAQKANNIALTPPMGWNSWNCFLEDVDGEKIKGIAYTMVSSGMKDAGYEYVIIDDGWATKMRDKDGRIIVDSIKFPNGIKPIADYIHSLGLKFGIYSAPGCLTCAGYKGSLGYEQIDADDYASWRVDFLKYDWCQYPTREKAKETSEEDCRKAFELMRDCLAKTGRKIIYSVHDKCTGLSENDALPWVKSVAHMHRTSGDIKNDWNRMLWCLESTANLWPYASPGYWNDPDMLEVGNESKEYLWGDLASCVKMTTLEYRTHFSMWCMVAAPLFTGNNLRIMSPDIIEILTNKEVIALDQDSLGKQGKRIGKDGDLEVWLKELSGSRWAIALLNRSGEMADIQVHWKELGLSGILKVRDLWEHKDLGEFNDWFEAKGIQSHEAKMLLVENSNIE